MAWKSGEYIGRMFRALAEGLSARIPSRCAVCHRWPSQPVCDECVGLFGQPAHRCKTCAIPLHSSANVCGECVRSPPPFDAAFAAVAYAYPWSAFITDFKFQENTGWSHFFASLMRNVPWVEPTLDTADCLLPMPLSPQRLQHRGFNQSLLLARALVPDKVHAQLLLRVQDTPPQSSLPRSARMQSVQHAFAVDPMQRQLLAGKRVILVDDVMTTGASLTACASVLRLAGAAHITALVLARTE